MSRLTKDNQIKRLTSIIEASKLLNSTLNLRKVLKIILELATKHSRAAKGTIYLVDHHKKEIWSEVQKGKKKVLIHLPFGRGIAGAVAKTGDTVNIRDAYKDSRFYPGIDERTGFRTKSMICMPMRNDKGKIVGVFQLLNKRAPIKSAFSRGTTRSSSRLCRFMLHWQLRKRVSTRRLSKKKRSRRKSRSRSRSNSCSCPNASLLSMGLIFLR